MQSLKWTCNNVSPSLTAFWPTRSIVFQCDHNVEYQTATDNSSQMQKREILFSGKTRSKMKHVWCVNKKHFITFNPFRATKKVSQELWWIQRGAYVLATLFRKHTNTIFDFSAFLVYQKGKKYYNSISRLRKRHCRISSRIIAIIYVYTQKVTFLAVITVYIFFARKSRGSPCTCRSIITLFRREWKFQIHH